MVSLQSKKYDLCAVLSLLEHLRILFSCEGKMATYSSSNYSLVVTGLMKSVLYETLVKWLKL